MLTIHSEHHIPQHSWDQSNHPKTKKKKKVKVIYDTAVGS